MVRAVLARHRGHEVKTLGDGFLVTFEATGRALRCAAEILAGARDLGLELRAGVHTVKCRCGGSRRSRRRHCEASMQHRGTWSGPCERGGAEQHGGHGFFEFDDHGDHELKGVRLRAVLLLGT